MRSQCSSASQQGQEKLAVRMLPVIKVLAPEGSHYPCASDYSMQAEKVRLLQAQVGLGDI